MKDFQLDEQIPRKDTVTSRVYDVLRQNILNINFKPGDALSEKEISVSLGVSRTPVREAFIRLEREGLLNIYPQRGSYISKISIKRTKEERFLRETLECALIALFIKDHTQNGVEKLQQAIKLQKQALENSNFDDYMDRDVDFHNVFFEETSNSLCKNILTNYSVNYKRIRLLSIKALEEIASLNIKQHEQLCQAILDNDYAEAEKICKNHLQKIFIELDRIVETYPDYFID